MNKKIFKFSSGTGASVIAQLGKSFGNRIEKYDKEMQRRMGVATNLIWRTAHAKRPYISKEQMKAEGRSHRVSDPNAAAGVPVAAINGGRLQASVRQKVMRSYGKMSFEGQVSSGGGLAPYAAYLEFGTSKMPARPFMRPAIALNREAIKRAFGAQISSNL